MVTIKEIAKRVGVSPSEVSRVLNGNERPHRSVSEQTRQRILQAAVELSYQPNMIARALVTQRTHIVGAIVYHITNPYFGRMAMGIEAELRIHGMQMLLSTVEQDEIEPGSAFEQAEEYLKTYLAYNVAGILFWNWSKFTRADQQAWQAASRKRPPLVLLGGIDDDVTIDHVGIDQRTGGRMVTEHLIALGHRRIAYAGNDVGWPGPLSKHGGYVEALRTAALEPEVLAEGVFLLEDGYRIGRALVNRSDPPTAVVTSNDYLATGLIRALLEAGWRVPEQVAVTGFDDNPMSAYGAVSITTVRPPYRETTRAAVELLMERIRERRDGRKEREEAQREGAQAHRRILLKPSLVARESTLGRKLASERLTNNQLVPTRDRGRG